MGTTSNRKCILVLFFIQLRRRKRKDKGDGERKKEERQREGTKENGHPVYKTSEGL
jgi:hypothetical protein